MLSLSEVLAAKLGFILLTALLVDVEAQSQSTCTTLRQEVGVCVPILTCETITQLLTIAPRPLPPAIVAIVRMAHCGTFDNNPHVCCSMSRVTTRAVQPPVTTTTPRPYSMVRQGLAVSDGDLQAGMAILEATSCGQSDIDRIANGENAVLSEYPWMAMLIYDAGLSIRVTYCGGSLITDRYVLSAAHCIRHGHKLVSVRLGEHDTNEAVDCEGFGRRRRCAPPVQEIDIEEAIYHPEYTASKYSNDIALIRLIRPAEFKTSVQPICLPITNPSREATINRIIIAGWGRMENGQTASVLQKAVVPLQPNEHCQQIYRLIRVTDTHLCAGGMNRVDTCVGDSGGPMFFTARYRRGVQFVQYGVVSGGSTECGGNSTTIFSKVISYLPWIAANIKS